MVAPTGVPAKIAIIMPIIAQITETTPATIVTAAKLLKSRITERAGKIIKADTNKEPTKFIANTIMTATIVAINKKIMYNDGVRSYNI